MTLNSRAGIASNELKTDCSITNCESRFTMPRGFCEREYSILPRCQTYVKLYGETSQ